MNLQLVLGAEAYGVNTLDENIVLQKNISNLKPGSFLFLLDGKEVYVAGTTVLANYERVQLVTGVRNSAGLPGMTTTLMSVPIPRRAVMYVDHEVYSADVAQVVELDFTSVADNAKGEGMMTLSDSSYNRTIKNDKIVISYNKKATVTRAVMLNSLRDKINNHNNTFPVTTSFVTAAVNGAKLVLTMTNSGVDFSTAMDGIFIDVVPVTTTPAVVSITQAIDILATEKEYSGNMGNGGYQSLGEAFYSFPQQTDLSVQYDVFHIKWQGEHDMPQNRQRSAVLWLKIAVPTAQGAAFKVMLDAIFGSAYDKATGELVPSADKARETDQNPAT